MYVEFSANIPRYTNLISLLTVRDGEENILELGEKKWHDAGENYIAMSFIIYFTAYKVSLLLGSVEK